MAELMRKTKRELVALIQDMEAGSTDGEKNRLQAAIGRMRQEQSALQSRLGEALATAERLKTEAGAAREAAALHEKEKAGLVASAAQLQKDHAGLQAKLQQAEAEIARLATANETAEKRVAILQQQNDVIARENSAGAEVRAALESGLAELRGRLAACEAARSEQYDLFRSFVDDDHKKILLLDTAYAVAYVNRAAASMLGLDDGEAVQGKRFFDFMPFKDAIKVKEKIDKAFMGGETEKAKKVRLRSQDGEVKLKISRVRYRDRPSVKIVVK